VRKHQRFVLAVALRHMPTREDAEDIAQDVFVRVAQKLGDYRGESTMQTWLYRITVNLCRSHHRKNKLLAVFGIGHGEYEIDVTSHDPLPSHQAEHNEFDAYVRSVLAEIPPKQRETFCMRFYDELSYDEISDITGTSVGALKSNYHWAIKKLADAMKNSEYYHEWKEQR
jgi:RNA polymerase sigma-70 factor (ECF subfamily)